mmetsp:Transcript_16967/g.41779  ORF Transcript_16967/g.41779 Transcript_16967/m.41779 type:complete len:327 (-) Transcript_16967:751-1731(-)
MRLLLVLASVAVVENMRAPRPLAQNRLRSSIMPPRAPTPSASSSAGSFITPPEPPQDDEERRRKHEFWLNVGQVIDTIQSDYPDIFDASPDFTIYEPTIELTDPSGVSLRGLQLYKNCFTVLRLMRRGMASVDVRCKVCHSGWDPYLVRARWNVAFSSRIQPGRTYFIDGVSAYTLSERGYVKRHELQNIIINGREVELPYLRLLSPLHPNSLAAVLGFRIPSPVPNMMLTSKAATAGRAERREDSADEEAGSKQSASPARPLFPARSGLEFCETSYDCDYPQFCCDLLLAKVCCSNGAFAPVPQTVPVPIPVDQPDDNPFQRFTV